MAEKKPSEKENKVSELTDEQVNEATGGRVTQTNTGMFQVKCSDCGKTWNIKITQYISSSNLRCKCGSTNVQRIIQ